MLPVAVVHVRLRVGSGNWRIDQKMCRVGLVHVETHQPNCETHQPHQPIEIQKKMGGGRYVGLLGNFTKQFVGT